METPASSAWALSRSRLRDARRGLVAAWRRTRAAYGWRDFAPLVLPLVLVPWLYVAVRNFAGAAVWRDIDMFNYAGWCLRKGERIYDTIATPDGPFVFALHAVLTFVAGSKDQALRKADLAFNALAALTIGVLLVPRNGQRRVLARVVWALVALALWFSHIAQTTFTSSMQREGYYVALGCIGMCLAYASWQYSKRIARWMLLGGGLLAGLLVFGKQSGVIYVAFVGLTALCLPADPLQTRSWRLAWVGAGVGLAAVLMMGLVVVAGSPRGFYEWYFRFAVVVYRFFEPQKVSEILIKPDRAGYMQGAAIALVGGFAAIAVRALPARAVAFALAPAVHFALAVVQLKGWEHHYLPVRASTYVFFLVALAAAWTSAESAPLPSLRSAVAVAVLLFVGERALREVQAGPWLRESEQHLEDSEVKEAHAGADFVRDHTRPDDCVLYYGNDPLVLFAAERRPTLPTETVLMLDFASPLNNTSPQGPGPDERYEMLVLQRQVRDDACRRIVHDRPAAMVFTDHAAAGGPDGVADVTAACPALHSMLEQDYELATTIQRLRIFLRKKP